MSFSCSSKDLFSPDRLHELTAKVSNLELVLEMESQQKNEAMKKVDTLSDRVKELELQLQSEAQQSDEALENITESEQGKNRESLEQRAEELKIHLHSEAQDKIHSSEHRVADLEIKLQSEAKQKHEATEKAELLELRVSDLERQLNEQSQVQVGADKQVKRDSSGRWFNVCFLTSALIFDLVLQMRNEFAETIQLCEALASEKVDLQV